VGYLNFQFSSLSPTLTSRATHAYPTSPRSTGLFAILDCISSSSSLRGIGTCTLSSPVLALFRLAYPLQAGTEIKSAEPPYPVRRSMWTWGTRQRPLSRPPKYVDRGNAAEAPGAAAAAGGAAAKTKQLGHDNKRPAEVLETASREAALKPRFRRNLGAA